MQIFRMQILSIANFYKAILSIVNINKADFYDANLFKTNFSKADLSQLDIQGIDLSQTQLIEVDLRNKNLEESNLNNADLSKANLSNANLRRIQAIGTNFCNAILTGACVEDWHTNIQTNLNDVICEYIYLKQNKQERRPHNPDKIFVQGEFSQLFQKAIETVDLIFSDGINWQAFLHSFQKLQIECHSEELTIQAIEKKSGGAFVIRVEVPSDVNKAEIEKYLENEYQLKLKSIEEKYKLQLGTKDEQINIYRQHNTDLLEIIKLKAIQPVNLNNSMSNINQYHSGSGDNVGQDKNTTNIYNSTELTEIAEDIQTLLKKLEQTYNPNTTTGKMTIATKAIEHIEQNKSLSTRVLSALEKGGAAWLQAKLINPSASFLIAALEDWQKTKQ